MNKRVTIQFADFIKSRLAGGLLCCLVLLAVSGNSISFNSTGKIKATITQFVGFNLSYVINSSGTYDKSAGKGSVTVSAY